MSKSLQPIATWIQFVGLVAAGVTAAVLAYFVLTSIGKVYPTPPELLNLGAAPTPEERAVAMAAKLNADCGNGIVWLGLAGGILSGALIFAGGLLRRSGRRTTVAVISGTLLAAILGCGAGYWTVWYHDSVSSGLIGDRSEAEIKFLMMHAIGWAAVGFGAGVGFGLLPSTRTFSQCVRAAVIGGVAGALAGAAYPVLVGIAAPMINATHPIPEPGVALVTWLLIPAVVFAGILGRTGNASMD